MHTTLRHWLSLFATSRGASALLGAWLFVSAFVLPHTFDVALIASILGVLIMVSSAAELAASEARYLVPILAVLLAVSALALPGVSLVTRINQGCVAIFVLGLSRLHGGRGGWRRSRQHAHS